MLPAEYCKLKERLKTVGYDEEIQWAEDIKPCTDHHDFFNEYAWVVLNSGMKEQIARGIWGKILTAYSDGKHAADVFGHKGKATAIDVMRASSKMFFRRYSEAPDKMAFLQSLPWIGPITKYHLAKNLGFDCVKPDRHLVRIAAKEGKTPNELCQELRTLTGDRIAVIDTVIWRAANLGMI
jgi:hypothetical protein